LPFPSLQVSSASKRFALQHDDPECVFPDEDVVSMPSADSIGVGGDVGCHHIA
jgi:hypothetical protein